MRINFLYKGVLVAATLCVAPAALPAAPKASQPGTRAMESSKGAMPTTASNLLRQIQIDALSVQVSADQLRSRLGSPFLNDWESDADLLQRVRDQVNEMDKLLSQLRENQAEASPWQQKAIERIALRAAELTNSTEDAIVTLNNCQAYPYFSNLPGLAGDIYNEASQIRRTERHFEEQAKARHEVGQLQQTLGLKSNS
jgi:gas vesicle protein